MLDIAKIKLNGDRILILPDARESYTTKEIVPDEDANKGKDPLNEEIATKEVEREVYCDYQTGVVLSVGNPKSELLKIGERVIYPIKESIKFDLLENAELINYWSITGIVSDEK